MQVSGGLSSVVKKEQCPSKQRLGQKGRSRTSGWPGSHQDPVPRRFAEHTQGTGTTAVKSCALRVAGKVISILQLRK